MVKVGPRVTEGFRKLYKIYNSNFLEYICGALLLALTAVCFLQVTARYFLVTQWVGWAEEFSRLFFIWGIFLGAVVAVKRDVHLGVDIIINRLPKDGRLWASASLFKHLCMGCIAVILVRYGLEFVDITAGDHLTTLGYPRNFFYWPAPVSGFLILIYMLPWLVRDIRFLLGGSS